MPQSNHPRRKGILRSAVVFLIAAATFCHALADDVAMSRTAEKILNQKGSLTLRDTPLSDALFTISETWNVNLLFSEDMTGNVNGVFRDVTLRELLGSVLLANGYGYRPRGQSLIIMKTEALGDSNAMLQRASIRVPAGQGEEIVETAKLLLSPQGKIQAMASFNALFVIDYAENIQQVRDLVESLAGNDNVGASTPSPQFGDPMVATPQQPLNSLPLRMPDSQEKIAYFSPRHTTASSLQEAFTSFLGPQARVVVIPTENRIAIVATPQGIQLAQQIFHELDQPRSQVRITALIYDVNVGEIERLGVNWTHNARFGGANQMFDGKFGASPDPVAGAFALGAAAADAAASSTTLGAARLTTLNRYLDLSAVVSALDQVEGARLLANPSVTVIDREEASIRIVTEIPIQQLTQTPEGGNIGTTSFREAGVTLTVTPQIGGDGTITMNVIPSFSVLSGFSEGQPIIDSREASTTVRIANGQTLVIGGLRQRSEVETVAGIPKIMKWKYLGKLFREHDTTIRESELIVFLRPEITGPNNLGTEREQAGLCVAQHGLNKLNWPSTLPVIPDCGDPYCPYHNPRPRLVNPNGGYMTGQPTLITPYSEPRPLNPAPEFVDMPEWAAPEQMELNDASKQSTEVREFDPPEEAVPLLPAVPEGNNQTAVDPGTKWDRFIRPAVAQAKKQRLKVKQTAFVSRSIPARKPARNAWPAWTKPLRPRRSPLLRDE